MSDDAVLAANNAFYRAFNEGDVAAMERIWASRAPVLCIHPGWNVLTGREAVIESWRRILDNPQRPRIVSGGAQAVRLAPGAALVVCREFAGGTPLIATNAFVEEDGEWKLAHHHAGPVAL